MLTKFLGDLEAYPGGCNCNTKSEYNNLLPNSLKPTIHIKMLRSNFKVRSSAVVQRQSYRLECRGLRFNPQQGGICLFLPENEIKRDGKTQPQLLHSAPKYTRVKS